MRLRGLLYPVREPRVLQRETAYDLPMPAAPLRGFYLGADLAHGAISTKTIGTRGSHGSDSGDFGAHGAGAGLFAGYGWIRGRWYGGIELEAEASDTDWFHSKDKPASRTSSVDKEESYGLALRAGYVAGNGSLLYGRVGATRATFDTAYRINDDPSTVVEREYTETGVRYGMGTEMPAGRHLFWRMEYSHTSYGDYSVDYGTGVEQFDVDENRFKLGLSLIHI